MSIGSRWSVFVLFSLGVTGLLFWLLSSVHAQDVQSPGEPEGDGPWVVRAYYADRQMVNAVAAWAEPWEVVELEGSDGERGYIVVEVTRAQYELLLEAGFRVEIDEHLTARLNQPNVRLAGQTAGIPGYPCYRTVEETFATAEAIAAAHPHLATWTDVGDSWEKTEPGGDLGYDIYVLRLTNSAVAGPKPKLFVMSALHAREYTPAELTARFAEYLVDRYSLDADVTWLLDYHEIHLLLQANPDGRKKAETGLSWRKNTNQNYCSPTSNDRGADLNRNFEFQWNCCGGSSGNPCAETFRGSGAASEPETQAIQGYVRTLFPDQRADDLGAAAPVTTTGVFVDLHSYGELVLWPWGFTSTSSPNGTALQTLGRKFAYLNGYRPDQAWGLYPTEGTSDGFAYGDLGLAAYTFELGTAFFQGCSAFESTILPDNLAVLIYAAKVARTPYLTPAGPDALSVGLSASGVVRGGATRLTAIVDDTRYNNQNGYEPTQNIVAAEYYLDVPPWITTTVSVAYPMTATDGAYDAPIEGVEAAIDTSDLSAGRHLVYVRGQDADGHWGAYSAVFLHILERGVIIEPAAMAMTGNPGTAVTYTLRVTNTGFLTDSFGITVTNYDWGTVAIPSVLPDLESGAGVGVQVQVSIPPTALAEEQDVAVVRVTSQGDGVAYDRSVLTTTASYTSYVWPYVYYYPLVLE